MRMYRLYVQTKTLASPSAPALAIYGRTGWNATSKMLSSNFLRCAVISWTQVLVSRFHRRTEQSCEPESRKRPLGSNAKPVTASRWATMACERRPDVTSQKRMCRSSWAVTAMPRVGCERTRVAALSQPTRNITWKQWTLLLFLVTRNIVEPKFKWFNIIPSKYNMRTDNRQT